MPTSCSAYNCKNRFQKKSNITFHRFPKDEVRRMQWIIAVRRSNWNPSRNTHLCSEHFEPDCFYKTVCNNTLKPYAVPTIFNFGREKRRRKPRASKSARSPPVNKNSIASMPARCSSVDESSTASTPERYSPVDESSTASTPERYSSVDNSSAASTHHPVFIRIKPVDKSLVASTSADDTIKSKESVSTEHTYSFSDPNEKTESLCKTKSENLAKPLKSLNKPSKKYDCLFKKKNRLCQKDKDFQMIWPLDWE